MDRARKATPDRALTKSTSSHQSLDRRKPVSRSKSYTAVESDGSRAPIGMAIPHARTETAPPPLPPPRWNKSLENGMDLGFNWANSMPGALSNTLAPIKPGSSLHGGYGDPRRAAATLGRPADESDEMDLDETFDRKGGMLPSMRAPWSPGRPAEHQPHTGVKRPTSPGNIANQR